MNLKIKKFYIANKIYCYEPASNKIILLLNNNEGIEIKQNIKNKNNKKGKQTNDIRILLNKHYNYPEQLIINITEDCNLRCKYCIYSKKYPHTRNRSSKTIQWNYIKIFLDRFLTDKKNQTISFYGGEPLLFFSMIKDTVNYSKKKSNNIFYSLTTNGTLLNKEIIKFLMNNNFILSISVDNNSILHNKNRIYPNGAGSFEIVKNNIMWIKRNFHSFYNNNIIFLSTITKFSNYEFNIDPDFNKSKFITTLVEKKGEKIFSQISEYIIESNNNQFNEEEDFLNIFSILIEGAEKYPIKYGSWINRLIKIHFRKSIPFNNIFGGSCLIYDFKKIFLSTEGKYFICEKLDYSFSIGSVNDNRKIISKKIENVINEFYKFKKRCKTCWARKLCSLCYVGFAEPKNIFKSNYFNCIVERREIIFFLELYIKLLEKHGFNKLNKFFIYLIKNRRKSNE